MAKLKLTLPVGEVAITGKQVSFVAPCDSAGLTHLIIEDFEFELVDSNGNNLPDGAFKSEAMVSVILNVESAKAFIQNADINYQLKQSLDRKADLATTEVKKAFTRVVEVPENSSPYAEILQIGGRTRKCTNLFPSLPSDGDDYINGIYFDDSKNGDGIVMSGTATADAYIVLYEGTLIAGRPYTISGGVGSAQCRIYVDGNWVYDGTFTPTNPNVIMECGVPSGTSIERTIYPMLNEGTTALPYEPYFKGFEHAVVSKVESIGANLIDIEGIAKKHPYHCEFIGDDVVITTSSDYNYFTLIEGVFEEDTQYTFSFVGKQDVSFAKLRLQLTYTDGSASVSKCTNDYTAVSLTSVAGKTVKNISAFWVNGTTGHLYIKRGSFMLNKGYTALPYTTYHYATLSIPKEVQTLGDYGIGINESVCNYIDYEKKQFVKQVDFIRFTGSDDEEWVLASVNDNGIATFNIKIGELGLSLVSKLNAPICSWFEIDESSNEEATSEGFYHSFVKYDVLHFRSASCKTVEEWRALLSSEKSRYPLDVVYQLAEPTTEDISDILSADSLIEVEGGGIIVYGKKKIPSMVKFTDTTNKILSAHTFVEI